MTTKQKPRASKKPANKRPGKVKQRVAAITATTKKMVDQMLLKLSPAVEKQLEQISMTIDRAPSSLDDFKLLGFKVLERAKVLSATLRTEKAKKRAVKIVKKNKRSV